VCVCVCVCGGACEGCTPWFLREREIERPRAGKQQSKPVPMSFYRDNNLTKDTEFQWFQLYPVGYITLTVPSKKLAQPLSSESGKPAKKKPETPKGTL
jgi:hypothetical protein